MDSMSKSTMERYNEIAGEIDVLHAELIALQEREIESAVAAVAEVTCVDDLADALNAIEGALEVIDAYATEPVLERVDAYIDLTSLPSWGGEAPDDEAWSWCEQYVLRYSGSSSVADHRGRQSGFHRWYLEAR